VTGSAATGVAETAQDDLAERIERVALRLFIRDGFHGVSFLSIGRELGISHSNVHYYYRTKLGLADAVLKRVAGDTIAVTSRIWRDPDAMLANKFVRMRDWVHSSYLQFNPDGKGGRPWGLLSRFSMDADALSADMRRTIRATLKKQEVDIRFAVGLAISRGEFCADAPADGIALLVLSVIHLTGQLTRYSADFSRFDELLRWTIATLNRAYGAGAAAIDWPPAGSGPEILPLFATGGNVK
jgi:AcrR family transcriptional regulator